MVGCCAAPPGVPAGVRAQAGGYRYRRGCFQINLALSARPRFRDPRLDVGGGLNLGRGVDALVTSPADLAKASPNAGPGDHAAGDNSLLQALIQRPIPAHAGGHRTVVPGTWLIGAATWPGPGVSGASGRAVVRALLGAAAPASAAAPADRLASAAP
jgi:phytoene dehydrogenase-like protein